MNVAPTIATDVVTLSAITDADAATWFAGSDEDQVAAFEFPHAGTIEDVRRAITQWRAAWDTDGPVRQWALRTVPEGVLAGGVELRAIESWNLANLSYVVFPPFRGRGLATTAARAAIDYAVRVLGTKEITLEILQGNAPSRHVAQKLSARWVGISPSHAGSTFDRWRIDVTEDAVARVSESAP